MEQKNNRFSWLKKAGTVLRYVAALLLVIGVIGLFLFADEDFWTQPLGIAGIIVMLAILLGQMGLRCFRYFREIRRIREETARERFEETPENLEQSILYLRPFHTDSRYTSPVHYRAKTYTSVESLLQAVLAEKGKMIAIGKPGEKLQPLGAKRVYASDNEWKQKVLTYLKEARYVLLYIDFTPGVLWEIEQSLDGYMDKIILIPRVYNLKASLLRNLFLYDVLTFLYPLYKLFFEVLWLRRSRRGRRFYKYWKNALGEKTADIRMDDSVSAVIFEEGKAVAFRTRNGSIEAQLDAIVRAVQAKTGKTQPQAADLRAEEKQEHGHTAGKKEKKLRFNATLSGSRRANGWLFPMGHIAFGENGLCFKHNMLLMRINFGINKGYRYHTKEVPYSSIVEILDEKRNTLQLCTDTFNLRLYLSLPAWHAQRKADIRELLERRGACGMERRDTTAIEESLGKADRRSRLIAVLISLVLCVCAFFIPNSIVAIMLGAAAWYAASVSRNWLMGILAFAVFMLTVFVAMI